jgi:hypothetical protein
MPSHKGEVVWVTVEAGFMAVEVFTVGLVSAVFMAGVFVAAAGSPAFTGAILGIFTAGVSRGFMAIGVFSAMIVFSFPVSDTRDGGVGDRGVGDGGVGVIPIHIGATLITPTILTIPMTRTALIGSAMANARFTEGVQEGRGELLK